MDSQVYQRNGTLRAMYIPSGPCFYCGGVATERDHFPIPVRTGGTQIVPACVPCHDKKDRITLDHWPAEWRDIVMSDLAAVHLETRLFLAKAIALTADAQAQLGLPVRPLGRNENNS